MIAHLLMSVRARVLASALVAAALTSPATAEAQTVGSEGEPQENAPEPERRPPTPDEIARARSLYERGVNYLRADRGPDAIAAFEAAIELDPRPNTFRNLALACERQGRLGYAVVNYMEALRYDEESEAGARFAPAVRAQINARIAALHARQGRLRVRVDPSVARVRLDQESETFDEAARSRVRFIDPGQHTIYIELEGYASVVRDVVVPEGEVVVTHVVLVPLARSTGRSAR